MIPAHVQARHHAKEPVMTNRPRTLYAGRLQRHQFLRFAAARCLYLKAHEGTLWITIDGEPEDIELDAGAGRCFDLRTPLIVGALGGEAALTVLGGPPAGWRERLEGLASAAFRRLQGITPSPRTNSVV
jgi:hypothetical protein